jgi:hypothetical protein
MRRSMLMFTLALITTLTAVAFSAESPFPKPKLGGCNSVCRADSDCTDTRCPFCEPVEKPGAVSSALCRSF